MTSLSEVTATPLCRSLLTLTRGTERSGKRPEALLNAPWGLSGDQYGCTNGIRTHSSKKRQPRKEVKSLGISASYYRILVSRAIPKYPGKTLLSTQKKRNGFASQTGGAKWSKRRYASIAATSAVTHACQTDGQTLLTVAVYAGSAYCLDCRLTKQANAGKCSGVEIGLQVERGGHPGPDVD